jgi:hypothetical protein
VRAAPAVSCAKLCEETHTSIQVQRRHSGIPRAMVLRLMPCSPRRRIRSGLMACLSPVEPTCLRGLGASNGRQDHTVLPYATPRFAKRLRRAWYPSGEILAKAENSAVRLARRQLAHGNRPANKPARRRCRVHHIPSRVRDDRDPPLLGDETAPTGELICLAKPAKCFCARDWTTQITLKSLRKLEFARSGLSIHSNRERRAMRTDLRRRADQLSAGTAWHQTQSTLRCGDLSP